MKNEVMINGAPLSEEEVELVLLHRARQARIASPARLFARRTATLVTSIVLVFIVVVWFQANQLQPNGGIGPIPAPLSWLVGAWLNAKC